MSWVKVASRSSTRRTVFRKVLSWCTWTPLMYLKMLRKLAFRVVICTGNLVPSGVWTESFYLVSSDKKYTWRKISELKNLHWSCSYREHSSPSDCHLFQRWSRILSPRCYRSSRSGNSWDTMAVNTGHRLQPNCDGRKLIPLYHQCLSCEEDCLENEWESSEFKHELFRVEMKIKYVHCKFIFWPICHHIVQTYGY